MNDHVTGNACGATTDSWHCAWEYSNGCVGNVGYDDIAPIPSVDYDETISHAVSGDDTDVMIENLTTERKRKLAGLGKGLVGVLNFLNSINPFGSAVEAASGENASGEKLTPLNRGLSATGASGALFALTARTGKVLDKAGDVLTKVGKQTDNVVETAKNLVTKSGALPGLVIAAVSKEKHHLLPRQFAEQFKRVGLNIDDFKISLPKDKHRLKPNGIHTGKYEDSWNGQWEQFFGTGTQPREREEILEQLEKMRKIFGI